MPREELSQLRIDWQACEGRGLCHELLPELITLDDWGYPIVSGPVPPWLLPHAQSAVRACPRLAVSLVREQAGSSGQRPGSGPG